VNSELGCFQLPNYPQPEAGPPLAETVYLLIVAEQIARGKRDKIHPNVDK